MADIMVRCNKLNGVSTDLRSIGRRTENVGEAVQRIARNLDFDVRCRENIYNSLISIGRGVEDRSGVLQEMARAVGDCATLYKKTEDNLADRVAPPAAPTFPEEILSLFKKMFGKAGLAGGLYTAFSKFAKGDIIGGAKGVMDTIKYIGEALVAGGTSTAWGKAIFGFIKKSADDVGTGVVKLGKNLKSFAKWGGRALTAIQKAFENKAEYDSGAITAERAVAETITESALEIGLGVAIGAAAAAVGAPVLVGGVVTAAVIWGGDCICKKFFGKGAIETVSDALLDFGEYIGSSREARKAVYCTTGWNCFIAP